MKSYSNTSIRLKYKLILDTHPHTHNMATPFNLEMSGILIRPWNDEQQCFKMCPYQCSNQTYALIERIVRNKTEEPNPNQF